MEIDRSIYDYTDYREFLRDTYDQLKSRDKKYSYRYFSRIAGFRSSSVLKDVIGGRRRIAPYSIDKFIRALKLGKEEGLFFKTLVLFNQAETTEERQKYAEQLFRFKSFKKIHPLKESQYNFFARWYLTVIREMVALKGFREDPEWISKKLFPPVSPAEVKRGMDELFKLGLIQRDPNGRLIQTDLHLTTPDEVTQSSVAQYHRDMMKRVGESIDRVPREKRELSGITLGMSSQTAKTVKEMIQTFRKNIVEFITKDTESTAVYQINLHLVPLVNTEEES